MNIWKELEILFHFHNFLDPLFKRLIFKKNRCNDTKPKSSDEDIRIPKRSFLITLTTKVESKFRSWKSVIRQMLGYFHCQGINEGAFPGRSGTGGIQVDLHCTGFGMCTETHGLSKNG